MEDVSVPKFGATFNSRDWRPPNAQNFAQPSAYPAARQVAAAPAATMNASYVTSADSRYARTSQISQPPAPQTAMPQSTAAPKTLTLLALRETIYAVTRYWLDGERLDYLLPSGKRGTCGLNELDLVRTTQLNSKRGISVTFSDLSPTNSSALN